MIRILALLFILLAPLLSTAAEADLNLRNTGNITVQDRAGDGLLESFISPILSFFYEPTSGEDAIANTFVSIAGGLKNFFMLIAVLFLMLGVLKLLFSSSDEEAVKKWKRNIIWVSVGIFVMQIAYSVWLSLYLRETDAGVNAQLGWIFWANIFQPIVKTLLMLASFGFLAMAIYSFYIMVTAGGDEERVKKGKRTIWYALLGFLLIRTPELLVTAIYGKPTDACKTSPWTAFGTCKIEDQNLAGSVNIFGKILVYISSFLALVSVILVIYAGWLVFTSAGEEEKLKKAKNTILYVAIGFLALIASHALFQFFFLRG